MEADWRGNKGVAIKRIHRRDAESAEQAEMIWLGSIGCVGRSLTQDIELTVWRLNHLISSLRPLRLCGETLLL